ncbi:hypothetical protein ACLBWS_01215, partial [Brucellaceae bacterium D45D]
MQYKGYRNFLNVTPSRADERYFTENEPLGSGPINLMRMASEMTRYARKTVKTGVVPPVEQFDGADRQVILMSEGCGPSTRLLRRKALKMHHISFVFPSRIRT